MDKEVLTALEGYRKAQAYIDKERHKRLAKMTIEESKAIFSALMSRDSFVPALRDERLQKWRLKQKVELREAFRRLAESKGYL